MLQRFATFVEFVAVVAVAGRLKLAQRLVRRVSKAGVVGKRPT